MLNIKTKFQSANFRVVESNSTIFVVLNDRAIIGIESVSRGYYLIHLKIVDKSGKTVIRRGAKKLHGTNAVFTALSATFPKMELA